MYDDDALIDLVHKYSFLYDKTHKWYKNKNERDKGWTKIGDILNMTSEECEQRWIILRNRFCTEMRKEKNSPTGCTWRPWSLYEDLSWLKPHVIPRNPRKKILHSDVRLIDLVHQHSFLYDKTHEWYKNNDEREKGWIAIADILKISAEVCEQRWGLLRNRFCTELRKENNTSIGSTSSLTWPLLENLSWLKPHVIPRRSRGSIPAPRLPKDWDTFPELETTTESIVGELEDENDVRYIIAQPDNVCETFYSHSTEASPEQNSQPSCSESAAKRPQPKLEKIEEETKNVKKSKMQDNKVLGEALTGAISQFTEIIKQEGRQSKEHRNDPDDLFGTMVVQYLKEIKDVKKKILIKSDILRIFENSL
ncbi:unnamed protein product [Phaedon cochleariae]|uniref:MADF domain-containing protein n=1 Tax=Phaedon cochleariae TaxID=80249 RepID=A0A9P0DP79_PHACE|nr:unnamed protein product [Phaedon cochleariae]